MAVYKVYCDESRIGKLNRHILMGGLWILKDEGWNFINDFENYCHDELRLEQPLSHMKWGKVPPKPESVFFKAYQYLVDLYFEYNTAGKAFFRTIITNHNYDFTHPIFHDGDYEKGFYNLYGLLLLCWLDKKNEYHIRVAKRLIKKAFENDSEKMRLKDLMDKLNNRFRETELPVKTIEARTAKTRRLIQLSDILMGAVGFHWEGYHRKAGAHFGKTMLANHIALALGKKDLLFTSEWHERQLNIFYFDPEI